MVTAAKIQQVIPGPRGLPMLGWQTNMLKLFRQPFQTMNFLYHTYGDVVSLANGGATHLFAFGPKHNFQILSNPDLFETSGGPFNKVPKNNALGRLFYNNLQTMNGGHHKQQRRLMLPAFHRKHIVQYRDDMVILTQQMLEAWAMRSEVNVVQEMQFLTQRIIVKTMFGVYEEAEINYIGLLMRKMVKAVPLAVAVPINLPGTPYQQTLRICEQFETYLQIMIERKRVQMDATDVLASLVHAHDEDGKALSNDELMGHAFTLYVAGHETTASALSWTLFLLQQHPSIYQNLLDELEGVLGGDAPRIEQLSQLKLLDGVIKESLRLLSPAQIGIRATAMSTEFGGYVLPKGANVLYSQFITHRLPELYEDPLQFKPERWSTLERSPYEYLPFSAGSHMCIAASFATQELKIVLAMILQSYCLELAPNTNINIDMTMRAKPDLVMKLRKQDRNIKKVPVTGTIHELLAL